MLAVSQQQPNLSKFKLSTIKSAINLLIYDLYQLPQITIIVDDNK